LPAFALIFSSVSASQAPRIASTSLCGDSYVLALAPDRISHLSWQSRDDLSTATPAQKRLPQAWDDPEKLVSLNADIILLGPGEDRTARRMLANKAVKIVTLNWGEDFDTVRTNARAILQTSDADAYLSGLDVRLSELKSRAGKRGVPPRILYLSRAGGTAGPGTYVDAAIIAAGAENAVTTPGWFTPDPEALMGYRPDVILTSFFEDGYESINSNGLRHGAVHRFIKGFPRMDIPGRVWPCAGPGLIEAAESIADELDKLE